MNRIEQLLAELCPEGVEFRELGEISQLVRGNGMPKSDFSETGVGAIHYGQIYTWYGAWTIDTLSFVEPKAAKKLTKVNFGDIIITNTSENLEDVCKAVAWLGKNQIVTGGHATVIKHNENPKYLSYWFQTEEFSIQKKKLATGTKVIDVSARNLAKIKIPIPPLAIQNEIVKILDKFVELQTELQARKIQYHYYRNALLTFPQSTNDVVFPWLRKLLGEYCQEGTEFKALGDIGEFIRGSGIQKSDFVEEGAGCIHYGQIHTHYGVWSDKNLSYINFDFAKQLRKAKKEI